MNGRIGTPVTPPPVTGFARRAETGTMRLRGMTLPFQILDWLGLAVCLRAALQDFVALAFLSTHATSQ